MLSNYLKITLRSLMKNKVFVLINTLGMGITLACCIVAYLNFDYNRGFDTEHVNADEIYRLNFVREFQDRVTKVGYVPRPIGANIKENVPEVDEVVRLIPSGGDIRIKDELFSTNLAYADPEFFDVFTFDFVAGNANDAQTKSNIYISSELATTYFGDEDAVGQPLVQVLDSGVVDFVVAGVYQKKPSNSSFMFTEAIVHYDNYFDRFTDQDRDNWASWGVTFLKILNPDRLSVITEQLQDYVAPQNKVREDFQVSYYYLDPFVGMAVRTEKEEVNNWGVREGLPSAAVVAPLIMAGLILILACFNFTNTSVAISGRRLKEIGLRKVMGGDRRQLIAQFLSENILLCLLALGVALVIAEFLVPAYSQMWDFVDLELNYSENIGLILFLVGLLVVTGFIAGSYPAFYISRFQATSILKGTSKFGGTNTFTKVLLGGQFSISILAIISAVGFVQNAEYQKELDLGYEGDGVLHAYVNGKDEFNAYKAALEGNQDILNMAGSQDQLMESYRNDPIRFEDLEREVDMYSVGDNFLETMQIDLIEGRGFVADSETDRQESIIVTERLVEEFSWDEAIGKRLVWRDTVQLFVIGVIPDMYTNALWRPLEPALLRYCSEEDFQFLTVSTDPLKTEQVNDYMKEKWGSVFPNRLYSGEYLNIDMQEALNVNNNILKLFVFLGVIATLLSVLGLFSLVSLNIIKRMKEIGVRKVLGAKIGNIAYVVNRQFLIIIIVASIFGSVAGFFMTDALMASIWAYHLQVGASVFIISIAILFIASFTTVGGKVYSAATANPAQTLRDE